jgi:hypothetical protein
MTTLVDGLATWHAAGSPPIGIPDPGEGPETLWRCVLGAWNGTMERREARLEKQLAEESEWVQKRKAMRRQCGKISGQS